MTPSWYTMTATSTRSPPSRPICVRGGSSRLSRTNGSPPAPLDLIGMLVRCGDHDQLKDHTHDRYPTDKITAVASPHRPSSPRTDPHLKHRGPGFVGGTGSGWVTAFPVYLLVERPGGGGSLEAACSR